MSDLNDATRGGAASGRFLGRAAEPPKPYYDVDESTGCWRWNRSKTGASGYGSVRYAGQYVGAHRAFYAYYVAPIPPGRVVMHLCDQADCVNPDHLALGTQAANSFDMRHKGRSNRGTKNGLAKLDEDKVREIRRRAAGGEPQKVLAAEFGVSPMSVNRVVNRTGNCWGWVA